MTLTRPIVIGLDGVALTAQEIKWLGELKPYGVILFSRNIDTPPQVKALTAHIRAILGADTAILIDQEGGRVQRLKPPHWPDLPSALSIGKLWRRHQFHGLEAANLLGQIIGDQLAELGITHTCGPVVDLFDPAADPVIGDRAFGETPAEVIPLATAFLDGLSRTGVTGILKHIPGMGRVTKDTHHDLAVIDTPVEILQHTDWVPFRAISGSRWVMTAHIVIRAWDDQPVTTSAPSITAIREHFNDPLIISDCLTMAAIDGSIETRVENTLNAGVDLALFSNGSDEARYRAVLAAGEPRMVREPLEILQPLSSKTRAHQIEKLQARMGTQTKTADPTWDRPSGVDKSTG
jgi:beta-N-acetylhexosaminidase